MMCGICGCSESNNPLQMDAQLNTDNNDHYRREHQVEIDILSKNKYYADNNRQYFQVHNITVFNIMSSPGAGKTTLLKKTMADLNKQISMAVLVGDQQTEEDAQAIKDCGGRALQINTGRTCHLDAHSIGHALDKLPLQDHSILFIENIGNLVCPALFDLGETYKVVVLSVTEGDNKPIKYPDMFLGADLLLLTKMDLLPYVEFDCNRCFDYAQRINPNIAMLTLSSTTGVGLKSWYNWFRSKHESRQFADPVSIDTRKS